MELIERFDNPEQAARGVREILARKDKVMGFGHAVYRERDPRNAAIKALAKELSESVGEAHSSKACRLSEHSKVAFGSVAPKAKMAWSLVLSTSGAWLM